MTQEAPRHVKAMNPTHFSPATAARREYVFNAPIGTMPEDLLDPSFWKHMVSPARIRRGDEITAVCVDDSWHARYRVLYVGSASAKVMLIAPDRDGVTWMINEGLVRETDSHCVKWIGPNNATRWGVFRKSDNEEMKRGFATEDDASKWMLDNMKNLAA